MTYHKVSMGLRFNMIRYGKYVRTSTWRSFRLMVITQMKRIVYWVANRTGQFDVLIRRRSSPANRREISEYEQAAALVREEAGRVRKVVSQYYSFSHQAKPQ